MFLFALIFAMQPDDVKKCSDAVSKLCPSKESMNECISNNFVKLREPCSFLWKDLVDPSLEVMMTACQEDISKYCKELSKAKECLEKNLPKFSKKCKDELNKIKL